MDFDILEGNLEAGKAKKRFLEKDLNLAGDGNSRSEYYEERRAFEISQIVKNYKYVIDIHETKSSDDTMLIVDKDSKSKNQVLDFCPIKKVLIWPSTGATGGQPIVSSCKFGFGLEIGTKNTFKTKLREISKVLVETIINLTENKKSEIEKEKYFVYAKIEDSDVDKKIKMKNFKKVKSKTGEEFYALMFGSYAKLNGYKMKRM